MLEGAAVMFCFFFEISFPIWHKINWRPKARVFQIQYFHMYHKRIINQLCSKVMPVFYLTQALSMTKLLTLQEK
jgi:hypothetical protein